VKVLIVKVVNFDATLTYRGWLFHLLHIAFDHIESTPLLLSWCTPLLGNPATSLVSMWLGQRAELPQTRYPLICIRAFGYASSYPYTTLAITLRPLVPRFKATKPRFVIPALVIALAETNATFSERDD